MRERKLFKNLFRVEKMMSDGSYSGEQFGDDADFAKALSEYFNDFLTHGSVHQIDCYLRVYDARNNSERIVSAFGMKTKDIESLRTAIRIDYAANGVADFITSVSGTKEEFKDFLSKVSNAYKQGTARYVTAIKFYDLRTGELITSWQADDISTIR